MTNNQTSCNFFRLNSYSKVLEAILNRWCSLFFLFSQEKDEKKSSANFPFFSTSHSHQHFFCCNFFFGFGFQDTIFDWYKFSAYIHCFLFLSLFFFLSFFLFFFLSFFLTYFLSFFLSLSLSFFLSFFLSFLFFFLPSFKVALFLSITFLFFS